VAVDSAAAAQAYARLISDPGLRRRMGQAGRQRAEQLFAWPRIIQAYEALWQDQERERREWMQATKAEFRLRNVKGRWSHNDNQDQTPHSTIRNPHPAFRPGYFPTVESAFAGYPTRWLGHPGDNVCFQTVLGAEENLERLLSMPLVNHVAASRSGDPAVLCAILAAGQFPCPLEALEKILSGKGVAGPAVQATLAWMLKYDLLRVSSVVPLDDPSPKG